MSAKAMGQVWDLKLPSNEQSVLLALADHADHHGGSIYPSNGLIAWKVGVNERTVSRLKKRLMRRGILVLVEAPPGRTKHYKIDFANGIKKKPRTPDKLSPPTNCHPRQSSATPPPTHGCHPTPDRAMSPEPSKQPSKQPSKKKASLLPADLAMTLDNPEFRAAWEKWEGYRRETGHKLTPSTVELQIKKLEAAGGAKAVAMIYQSIENGWRGLFEPRGTSAQRAPVRPGEGKLKGGADYVARLNIVGGD